MDFRARAELALASQIYKCQIFCNYRGFSYETCVFGGWFGLAFTMGPSVTAIAKTPPEVLTPYKAYRNALKADNKELAASLAYDAWQKAEEMMGDTQTTGDLASNFAGLAPMIVHEKRSYKKVVKAYERSIDLAKFYPEAPGEIELQRRIDFLGWANSGRLKTHLSDTYGIKALGRRVEEIDLLNTTYEADYLALKAQIAVVSRNWSKAEKASKRAISLYGSVKDGLPSYFKYVVPAYLAEAYTEQDKYVDAVLTYQDLIDRMETEVGHKNPVSAKAYGEWLELRDIALENHMDDPRIEDIRNYTVPSGRSTTELQPLIRKAPVFPKAFLRGSRSGWVQIKFDLDEDGRTQNAVVLDSTSKKLNKAALKCLKDWRYTPNAPADRRKAQTTLIRFDLLGQAGRRMRYERPVPI